MEVCYVTKPLSIHLPLISLLFPVQSEHDPLEYEYLPFCCWHQGFHNFLLTWTKTKIFFACYYEGPCKLLVGEALPILGALKTLLHYQMVCSIFGDIKIRVFDCLALCLHPLFIWI